MAAPATQDIGPELQDLIIGSDSVAPKPIVLFGEANFTFSIALASLRANSKGIIPPDYKITATGWKIIKLPDFDDAKKEAKDHVTINSKKMHLLCQEAENAARVSEVLDFSDNWHKDIDATSVPDSLQVAKKVVWFQCPWVPRKDADKFYNTAILINNFIHHMAQKGKQEVGDTLLIGISTEEEYIDHYGLDKVLRDGPGSTVINGYRYRGQDENIIKKILARGYKHKGYKDIHEDIINTHLTLVFKKEEDVKTPFPTRDDRALEAVLGTD